MAYTVSPYLATFDETLQGWTDQRFISRQELRALAMFSQYLVNLLEDQGWSYYGHSFKKRGRMGCLVVKADHEGTPHVVFTNAQTYTGSVVIFIRRLEADALEWRPDRFR